MRIQKLRHALLATSVIVGACAMAAGSPALLINALLFAVMSLILLLAEAI